MRKGANHADSRSGRKAQVRKTVGTKPMRSRAARNSPCSSGGRSASSGTGNQEMRSSASSIDLEPTIAPVTRLLPAFLIVLALLPATASAAAPSCPDDNADELGGSGEVFGVGPRYVIAGV